MDKNLENTIKGDKKTLKKISGIHPILSADSFARMTWQRFFGKKGKSENQENHKGFCSHNLLL